MKSLVLLISTVAMTCAVPLPQSPNEQQCHSSASDELVKDAQKFLTAYYEFIPRIISNELGEMIANPEEIKGVEEYQQRKQIKDSEPPKTIKALLEFFKQKLPLSASRIDRVVDYFAANFAKISKPGQDFIIDFIAKLEANEGTGNISKKVVNALIEADDKFKALSPSVKK